MLPAEGIVRAADRWLRLLEHAPLAEAAEILRQDAEYTDLTTTQYALGLDWLRELQLVGGESGAALQAAPGEVAGLLFSAAIAFEEPLWLEDVDTLVQTPEDLPADALALAETLQLSETRALAAIRQAHGKVDLARRKAVGAMGERLLVELLEEQWPGATRHVSEQDDGLGYDVELCLDRITWKLEVKSTTRRNRLRIYLSRNEFSVGSLLQEWRLVVLGLGHSDEIEAIATVATSYLLTAAPEDRAFIGRWESASFELAPEQLSLGLSFIDPASVSARNSVLTGGRGGGDRTFTWMPAGDLARTVDLGDDRD